MKTRNAERTASTDAVIHDWGEAEARSSSAYQAVTIVVAVLLIFSAAVL